MSPVTIDMQGTEDRQTITMLEGMLKQQRKYTDTAVAETMRLRKIIGRCDKCRAAHDKPTDSSEIDELLKEWEHMRKVREVHEASIVAIGDERDRYKAENAKLREMLMAGFAAARIWD